MSIDGSDLQATLDKAQHAQSLQNTSKALELYQHSLELLHAQIQAAAPASQQQQQLIAVFKDVLVKAEELKQARPANEISKPSQAQQTTAAASPGSGGPPGSAGNHAAEQKPEAAVAQAAPSAAAAAEYQQCKERARELAVQAVAADGSGQVAQALKLYSALLEVLNRCHRLESSPAVQVQIMARFQVYLERAELLRQLQGR